MSQGLTPIWRMAEAGNAGAGRLVAHLLTGGAALFALGALAGAIMQEAAAAVVFAWGTVLLLVVGMAVRVIVTRRKLRAARSGLLILTGLYILGPAVLAVPFHILAPTVDPASAYFEAASALTTTGASILRDVTLVPKTLIFWRALIAGAGGFICFVAALAIMAPLSIGGFEVDHGIERTTGTDRDGPAMSGDRAPFERGVEQRVFGAIRLLGVPYLAFLTLVTLGLAALGLPPFEAICLSLSAISTTGFAPVNGGLASYDSFLIEAVLIAAMVLAALGVATHGKAIGGRPSVYRRDPELRYLAICVAVVVAVIFLRHWIGAIETRSTDEISAAIESLWGAFFMAISFVTTTGLHSSAWQEASAWSGLETPGVMLLGLAIIGGGAASTAGGVKLIRAALLAKHSLNELSRLSHPASVRLIHSGGRVVGQRALRIVFVFVMLYILALGATALALAACGVFLVDALAASIAVVSNTGPVLPLIQGASGGFADMPPVAKILLCIGMVVGRLETLAVVAVLSPSGWRT